MTVMVLDNNGPRNCPTLPALVMCRYNDVSDVTCEGGNIALVAIMRPSVALQGSLKLLHQLIDSSSLLQ